ncbi:DMT family transporter [Deinococcus hopiensis]|uniref:Threonine/homoserine efflux transporter RhtA n=1 Tax=Deinococcus hopiensis KR-140 TaxID=695939 RepID=A0A1W1UNY2_9DEIO|nr:DMT family transporter [Deinococcus hopiensis]SMB82780.1 Threonine/homoserine efflux transporter RhtA [Deinococcus hopiensis KR-140]
MKAKHLGVICALGAALTFSTLSIFGKLAPEFGLSTTTLLFWRFVLASGVLWSFSYRVGLTQPLQLRTVALGLLYAAQTTLYFTALAHLSAGTTALILYLSPALVLGLTWVSGRRPAAAHLVAAACALLGVVVLAGQADTTDQSVLGWILALSSSFCYALYLFLGERLLNGAAAVPVTAHTTLGTALGLGLLGWHTQQLHLPSTVQQWSLTGVVALFPTVLALPATLFASQRLGADRTALLLVLEPVFVLVLAAALLHEPVGPAQWSGGGLILLGAVLVARAPMMRTTAPAENEGHA